MILASIKSTMEEHLKKRISELESMNDQLIAEIAYLDQLLKQIGFEEGLKTLKWAALELLEEDREGA
jgi:hypothetical protein